MPTVSVEVGGCHRAQMLHRRKSFAAAGASTGMSRFSGSMQKID